MAQSLILHPTQQGLWYTLLTEAQQSCAVKLGAHLESYLVFLLMRFMQEPGVASSILGLEFLQGIENTQALQRQRDLKIVGDKCLLFAGLFPQRAIKKRVKLSYFVHLGRTAYATIFETTRPHELLFQALEQDFSHMVALLQAMRDPLEARDLLQSFELWQETGDLNAWERLCKATLAIPCLPEVKKSVN